VNCCVAPAARLAVAGDVSIAVRTLIGLLELRDEAPPHPAAASSSERQEQRNEECTYLRQRQSRALIFAPKANRMQCCACRKAHQSDTLMFFRVMNMNVCSSVENGVPGMGES